MALLIKNAMIINAGKREAKPLDILCENGKIKTIAPSIPANGAEVVDAKGKFVLPGLLDIHVHFRVPGQEYKETIETGSRAAAKGGFTTVMCMPNTKPVIDSPSIAEAIIKEARDLGICNVIPIGAITRGQKNEELVDIFEMRRAGCLGLSDDGRSVVNSQLMRRAMEYSKMADVLLIEHCEDPLISCGGVMNEGAVSTLLGMKGDPYISETIIVARDIELANYLKARIHFCHMSCRRSVELIRTAKKQGIKVTAEACPHHFALTEDALKTFDANAKMNPPLRSADDVAAIKEGLKDGTIDCIVTDHAPHSYEEKELGMDEAPFGIIGLETALGLSVTELIKPGILTWEQLVDRMSTAPAKIVGLADKGVLAVGKDADIVIVDPDKEWVVTKEDTVSRSKNTPFFGWKLTGKVQKTIYAGKVVYSEV